MEELNGSSRSRGDGSGARHAILSDEIGCQAPACPIGASDAPPQFVRQIAVRRIADHGPGTETQIMDVETG